LKDNERTLGVQSKEGPLQYGFNLSSSKLCYSSFPCLDLIAKIL
jgi:hypothetical protein